MTLENYLLWNMPIGSNDEFNTIHNPIVHGNKLIILDEDNGVIKCLGTNDGTSYWSWTDAFDTYGDDADGFTHLSYIYQNILVIGFRNLTYGIDLETGLTLWHNKLDNTAIPWINGSGDKFVNKETIPNEKVWISLGDVQTGNTNIVYSFEREDEFNVGANLPLVFSWDNKEYITFTKVKWGFDENNAYIEDQWLHLYNLTDDSLEWVSDTIPLEYNVSGIAGKRPVFHDGQILLANDAIYSYNIDDGSLEWRQYYGNSFVLSTHLSADYGRVYGNNASGFMVSLDVHTGQEYFNVSTGGSASRIVLHDNKAYISSLTGNNGNERLFILDAFNGELIKAIVPPFMQPSNNRHFDKVITVDPETGYIYTADHVDILCFDPEL